MKLSMGAREILVGLTEKAMKLEQSMRAVFKELITDTNPRFLVVEPGVLQTLERQFDGLWSRAGLKRSTLMDGILTTVKDSPKTFGEIFEILKEDPEFKRMSRKVFIKAATAMLDADLLTGDQGRMWVVE